MKIRNDFVSNSSSSSYIVAIDFGKYDFNLFVKRTCGRCYSGKDDGSPGSISSVNEAALRSGMLRECLYLGNPVIGRIKEIWRRGEKYDHTFVKAGETDEFTPFRDLTENLNYLSKGETVSYLDENTIEYAYDDELPAWLSVSRSFMRGEIRGGTHSGKSRIKKIVAYVKGDFSENEYPNRHEIFCITKNTVKNTRDFLNAGYQIRFIFPIKMSKTLINEFLDKLEARIKTGETFIYAVAGDSGEGWNDHRLYMPDGYSNPFEDTPAQDVTGQFENF